MICLIVGHKESSPGAVNVNAKISEYEFNKKLAIDIKDGSDLDITIVYRDTYRDLPGKVNQLDPEFSVSLHCNAFNRKAWGAEMLYYHSSKKSKAIAEALQFMVVEALGTLDRGIKPKHSEDRGGYLLRYTKAPCVIAETFFIDNDDELNNANELYNELVNAYIDGIRACSS